MLSQWACNTQQRCRDRWLNDDVPPIEVETNAESVELGAVSSLNARNDRPQMIETTGTGYLIQDCRQTVAIPRSDLKREMPSYASLRTYFDTYSPHRKPTKSLS